MNDSFFDYEHLDVYRVARSHFCLVVATLPSLPGSAWKRADNLSRAAESILNNIAEGAGKPAGSKDRRKFYAIANGSSKECAAQWDILSIRGDVARPTCLKARQLLHRVVAMLTAMTYR